MVQKKNTHQTKWEYYQEMMITYGGSLIIVITDYVVSMIMEYLVEYQKTKSVTSYHLHVAKKLWKVKNEKSIK